MSSEEREDEAGSVREQLQQAGRRESDVVRVSAVGVAANVALAAFKAAVGLLSNSIAVTLDAVNNLSDAASSVITIAGTKLAARMPDRAHPFGFGRVEYLTTVVIAVLVLWAGATSLSESVRRILSPEQASYSAASLLIVAVAVLAKVALGRYFKTQGRRLASDSLVASGTDATMDAVLSASTLAAALVTVFAHVGVEAWVGAVISVFIVKAGVDILRGALAKILGERVDPGLARQVKDAVRQEPGVLGAYDLELADYGPQRLVGSIHVEVADATTAAQFDHMTRQIRARVFERTGVMLHTVGLYSSNTADPQAARLRAAVEKAVFSHPEVVEMHGFYVDERARRVSLDVIISFDCRRREELFQQIRDEVARVCGGYELEMTLDVDATE